MKKAPRRFIRGHLYGNAFLMAVLGAVQFLQPLNNRKLERRKTRPQFWWFGLGAEVFVQIVDPSCFELA